MLPNDNDWIRSSARCYTITTIITNETSNMHRMLIKMNLSCLELINNNNNNNNNIFLDQFFKLRIVFRKKKKKRTRLKLLLKSCAYYAGILNVFWIYLQKRRIRGDVAECLFLNCKPHNNRVLPIRDFFFYFPLPSYSISYIISKIYVFGLMKKKKEQRKKK